MTLTPEQPDVQVETGYGTATIPAWLYNTWNRYGWPAEHALKHIARHGVSCSCREPLDKE